MARINKIKSEAIRLNVNIKRLLELQEELKILSKNLKHYIKITIVERIIKEILKK